MEWGTGKLTCSRELFIPLSITYAILAQTQKIVSDLIDEANGFHTISKFLLNCLYLLDILHHHIHISILFKLFNPSETRAKQNYYQEENISDFNEAFKVCVPIQYCAKKDEKDFCPLEVLTFARGQNVNKDHKHSAVF